MKFGKYQASNWRCNLEPQNPMQVLNSREMNGNVEYKTKIDWRNKDYFTVAFT